MKSYRVKYTLEKIVVINANNPQEAEDKAASLEDFNYDFFGDKFEAEEMQDKTITTATYLKDVGVTQFSRKLVKAVPSVDMPFENIEEIVFLQLKEKFVEIRVNSFNLASRQIMEFVENICESKLTK